LGQLTHTRANRQPFLQVAPIVPLLPQFLEFVINKLSDVLVPGDGFVELLHEGVYIVDLVDQLLFSVDFAQQLFEPFLFVFGKEGLGLLLLDVVDVFQDEVLAVKEVVTPHFVLDAVDQM